jgi:long-subunit acyl-CoA synthetase (AMP-forming)
MLVHRHGQPMTEARAGSVGRAIPGDELTPTMKLKRKPIAAKYSAAIEELYAGEG